MKLISHRGNLFGAVPERENNPEYINEALRAGFEVEIDVWTCEGYFLGHDAPVYLVQPTFLQNPGLWCHAKTPEALHHLLELGAHCFCLANDPCTLTSQNYIWTSAGHILFPRSIACLPENFGYSNKVLARSAGICSDNIQSYKDIL
jgi:hypothetical protein